MTCSFLCTPFRLKRHAHDETPEPKISTSSLPLEIFQHIMSYLDMKTLYRMRSVSRFWSACIPGDAPALRSIMFLPNPQDAVIAEEPLLIHFDVSLDKELLSTEEYSVSMGYTIHCTSDDPRLNPLLHRPLARETMEKFLTTQPLCMRSQITRIPVREVHVRFTFTDSDIVLESNWLAYSESRCARARVDRTLLKHDGVTVGHLLSAVYDDEWWPWV